MRKLNHVLSENEINLQIPEKKKILRQLLLDERQKLAAQAKPQDWGAKQFFRALELLKVTASEIKKKQEEKKYLISCYFPIRNELDIACFADENWIFPRICENGNLKWFELGSDKNKLIKNKYGIYEKNEEECFEYSFDLPPLLCFIPGLAASKNGHRLGYGGGYYDRFLLKFNKRINSVLCLPNDSFIFDEIPTDENDQKVDLVVW